MLSVLAPLQGSFLLKENTAMGVDENTGFSDMFDLEPTLASTPARDTISTMGLIGNITLNIIGNISNSQANTVVDSDGFYIFTGNDVDNPMTLNIQDNTINISSSVNSIGGIIVNPHGPGPTIVNFINNEVSVSPLLSSSTLFNGISLGPSFEANTVTALFDGNNITVPASVSLPSGSAGIRVFSRVPVTDATLTNNISITTSPTVGFRFRNNGNPGNLKC